MKNKRGKIVLVVILAVIAILMLFTYVTKKVENRTANLDSELLRSKNYAQVTDEQSKVENTDFVKFSAFFTRDINGDGNAEKLLGTCKRVIGTDQLYMDLNVLTNGYLKDGKITINGTNFKYSMSMVKDSVLKNNYISDDVKVIELNNVNAGTQKLIIGNIVADIGNNVNNYSSVSSVTFTGTHVSDDGVETEISKTVDLTVDWYGEAKTELYTKYQATTFYYNYNELDSTTISFNFRLDEIQQELILKENETVLTIPELNGYAPTEVKCTNSNIESEYNNETKKLTIKRSSKLNNNGIIVSELSNSNSYNVNITYPKEAYDAISSYTTLTIPIEGFYRGYNNTNEEFKNPYKSNVVNGNITIVFRETPDGNIYNFYVDFEDKKHVKDHPYGDEDTDYRYIMSKQDILNLYDNIEDENKISNKEYVVRWLAVRGDQGEVPSMIMSETKGEDSSYGDKWNTTIMENYITNTGIYFSDADKILENDGTISIYNDDTNELIHTFTKEEWNNYTRENPYKYVDPVKHIRAETSKTKQNSSLSIYNIKELDTKKILADFTKEEVEDINLMYTYVTGVCNIEGQQQGVVKDIDYVYYVSEKSNGKISVETKKIPTQDVLNNKIYISAETNQYGDSKWKDGEFLVELPQEIIGMKINKVSIDNENVKLVAYDLYENDGKYFIKIITSNEEPESFKITVDCDMTPDPRSPSINKEIKLYSYNKYCNIYYHEGQDEYDVDSDNNTNEDVGISITNLNLLSPTSLITLETITNYNKENEITIAPNVAAVEKDQRQAQINIGLTNNYPNVISGVQILGKIPFEGNKFILNDKNLGSNFTTTMTNDGITIPEELKEKAMVYYSEKENPDKDLLNADNGWTLKEDVKDFSKIKTYLIDVTQYTIDIGKNYSFNYTVNIPEGISYNSTSYSNHAVFYELNTSGGKLQLSTEPNKVGLRIVRKYKLQINKTKQGFEQTKVSGATYTVDCSDTEGNVTTRILTTNSDGIVNMKNLFIGVTYTVKELKSPDNYLLNDEVLQFKVIEDETGKLQLETNSEKISLNNADELVIINTQDEPKYNVTITKRDSATKEPLTGVYFICNGKAYVTDKNGQITLEKLEKDRQYTLKEPNTEGYYALDNITFKFVRAENGNIEIESNNENFKNAQIQNNEEDLVKVNVTLENEKIPTYNLQILKVEENLKETDIEKLKPLKGAIFKLEGEDFNKEERLETDENGNITIPNLYQYVDGKAITGKYRLQELQAPNGYSNNAEEIEFKVVKNAENNLEINITNKEQLITLKDVIVENGTIKLIIQDKPLFKLTKTDSKTGKTLANAQFVIYEIDSNKNDIDYAKDVNGNYVGTINSDGKYVVTTDETGTIVLPLRGGFYRIEEIGYPEGYQENGNEDYFKIASKNEDIKNPEDPDGTEETVGDLEINTIEDLVRFSKSVNSGNSYKGKTVSLMRTLDFNEDSSYANPTDTSFGDLNEDGVVEGIKNELTTGIGFTPIGTSTSKFMGTFDGRGNEIKNLYIMVNINSAIGLFAYIEGAEIKNCGVTGEVVNNCTYSDSNAGGIVGDAITSKISNCHSYATIKARYNIGGIVARIQNTTIEYSYNIGEIISNSGGYIGGIVGEIDENDSVINKCYNLGIIKMQTIGTGISVSEGGIVGWVSGNNNIVKECNNIGNIKFSNTAGFFYFVGGLIGRAEKNNKVVNSYNTGNIEITGDYAGDTGGICGHTEGNTPIINCYNIGEINTIVRFAANSGTISGNSKSSWGNDYVKIENCYYLDTIELTSEQKNMDGTPISKEILKTMDFYNKLNVDGVWQFRKDSYPKLNVGNPITNNTTELKIENTIKKFNITTEIEGNSNNEFIGGTISGEDNTIFSKPGKMIKYVETVEYNDSNKREILVKPDKGYKVGKITLNGESFDIKSDEQGNYKIPSGYFTKVKQDYHIVVKFEPISNFIINKVDDDDQNKRLEGAKFKIEKQVNPQDLMLETKSNSTAYPFSIIYTGKPYVSTNNGIANSVSSSYVPIDLREFNKKFVLKITASISSESNCDIGYATITESTTTPAYNDSTNRFIYISGSANRNSYTKELDGGKMYYLHVGYKKDGSVNAGDDEFTINDISLAPKDNSILYKQEPILTTNLDGKICTNLDNNFNYRVTEIEAPAGYELKTNEQIINIKESEIKELTITNKMKSGNNTIKIKKVDSADKTKVLPGANFNVKLAIDDDVDDTNLLLQSGKSNFSNNMQTWNSLNNGKYSAVLKSGSSILNENGEIVLNGYNNWSIENWNEGSFGTYMIEVAIDKDFKPINTDNWYTASCIFGTELPYEQKDVGIIIDKNGMFALGYGLSSIVSSNVSALDGEYHNIILSYKSNTITFAVDGEIKSTIAYTSSGNEMTKLGIGWNTDSTNTRIKGKIRKIKIYKNSKELSSEDIKANQGALNTRNVTTNENGEAYITAKENNVYTITETKAPDGYVLDETPKIMTASNDSEIVIENKKPENYTITKIDKDTNEPIQGAKFAIYKLSEYYETIDFIKNNKNEYLGKQNEDGIYELETDANGKIKLELAPGLYKAVETKSAEGYALEESEALRTTYFRVEEENKEDEGNTNINNADLVINNIEDLVRFSNDVNSGNSYEGKTVVLARTLDFNEDSSYNNPEDTTFGDYNRDGTVEGIKQELTKEGGAGFSTIGNMGIFKGDFNGNNNEIKNIYVNRPGNSLVGLFGRVNNAKILNLGVDGRIGYNNYTKGGIVAEANDSLIMNCYNKTSIMGGGRPCAGGVVGEANYSEIVNCYNLGNLDSSDQKGGIVCSAHYSKIINCYNVGDISSTNSYAAGIAMNLWNSEIQNCYNIGNISGSNVGGIILSASNSTIKNCYYLNTSAGNGIYNTDDVWGEVESKTKEQMQSKEFVKQLNINKNNIITQIPLSNWSYNEEGYPTLLPLEIKSGKQLTITNKKLQNNLSIKKVDKETNQKLSGAKFRLETNKDSLIGSMVSNSQYTFVKNGTQYISNNNGKSNSVANAYFPIDLSSYKGTYELNVDYTISSESGGDIGYATITTSTNIPTYNENEYDISKSYRFISCSGSSSNKASIDLIGGKKYYLHIGYRKNSSTNSGNDRFYINDISLKHNLDVETNEDGIIDMCLPSGEYKIKETSAPYGYNLSNEEKTVLISGIDDVQELTFENEKLQTKYNEPNVIITKKDKATGEIMPGVKFMVLDEQGNYIKDYTGTIVGEQEEIDGQDKYVVTTDENGQIKLKLNIGKYQLVEVKSLEGYALEDKKNFEITNEDEDYEVSGEGIIISTNYPWKNYIIATSDGGMIETNSGINKTISARYTADNKELDITSDNGYVVKYNNSGKIENLIQISGLENFGAEIYEDTEGNFIVFGGGKQIEIPAEKTIDNEPIKLEYNGTNLRTIILKLNKDLKVIWVKNIDNFCVSPTSLNYIVENKEGNYIINFYGYSGNNIEIPAKDTVNGEKISSQRNANSVLIEYTKDGKVKNIYQNSYGIDSLIEKDSGGYIISYGSVIYELDSKMNEVRQYSNNISGINSCSFYATKDEGFIMGGTLTSNNLTISGENTASGNPISVTSDITPAIVLVKYDKNFKVEWAKAKSWSRSNECVNRIKQDNQGNYIVLSGLKLIKYNSNGDNITTVDLPSDMPQFGYLYTDRTNSKFVILEGNNNFRVYTLGTDNFTPITLEITNQKAGKVIVHHYLQGTGEEFGTTPEKLSEDEVINGKVPEEYTTSPNIQIKDYTLIKDEKGDYIIPSNASGTYTEQDQHVYYYYNKTPLKLTVHHYLEGTQEKLAEDEQKFYTEGDHYKTNASEEVLKKYNLTNVIGDEEKDITQNEEVTYYYQIKTHQITTKVEIPEGRAEKGGTITGEGETPYETVDYEQSSKKDIIITPEKGYKVKQIKLVSTSEDGQKTESTIYGNDETEGSELTYTEGENNTITLTKFQNMIADKEIIVIFEPDEGRLIVHHYIEKSTEKIYDDQITVKPVGTKVETVPVKKDNYAVVKEPEDRNATITRETQEKIYYYQKQYNITTEVIKHNETYKDGTIVKNVKGGTITDEGKKSHEYVLKNRNSQNEVIITPNNGYEIVKITINNETLDYKNLLDEKGKVTIPKEFFKNVQEDKHIQVEFRKKTKVYVKYLEEGTEQPLYTEENKDYIELNGYEGQEYETVKKVIPNYKDSTLGITDENKLQVQPKGIMYADDVTVIYWYTRVSSGIIVRHIETNEKGEEIELENNVIDGLAGLNQLTNRNKYDKYIPVDRKQENSENVNSHITIAKKEENSKTITFAQDKILEVWYFYEKQYDVTTSVKTHEEKVLNETTGKYETKQIAGGTISKEYEKDEQGNDKLDDKGNKIEITYEQILSRGDSKKQIELKPDENYRVKSVIKQKKIIKNGKEQYEEEQIFVEDNVQEDGSVILPEKLLVDVQNDYNIQVEFEKIPAKVIVQYKDAYTKESIHEDKILEGFVNDEYNEQRISIENYIPADPEPENNYGKMTKEPITVTYWYTKQFKITAEVKPHEEELNNETGEIEKVQKEGGTIKIGENLLQELVTRGDNSINTIIAIPDQNYRIKYVTINGKEIDLAKVLQENGTAKLPLFENMQEDKHIVVEFERIPTKLIVKHLDVETNNPITEDEQKDGFVGENYKTNPVNTKFYKLVDEKYPQNSEGKLTNEETIVTYYYEKLPFNLKIQKEVSNVLVNGEKLNVEENNIPMIIIAYKDIKDTTITIEYKIKVTNTESIAGKAVIEEKIPKGFELATESNPNWKKTEDTYTLQTDEILPGETKEYVVVLNWKQDTQNEGYKSNEAKIISTENEPKFDETTVLDNKDDAVVQIIINKTLQDVVDDIKDGNTKEVIKDIARSVKTGDAIIVSLITLAVFGTVLVIVFVKRKNER